MAPASIVVVVWRSPEKMQVASTVLEAHGFVVVGAFTAADALGAIAEHDALQGRGRRLGLGTSLRATPLRCGARGSVATSWLGAEEPDDRFEKLDGAVCSTSAGFAPDAHPADVESVVEGCGVVVSGTEEIERDPAYVAGSGVGGEVGAAVEDLFGAFHEAPSTCEALASS